MAGTATITITDAPVITAVVGLRRVGKSVLLRQLAESLREQRQVVYVDREFGLLVIKNYMDDIPNDIVEASVIDGCSHLTIYWRIVLPLSLPALAAVTIFTFLNAWNEFLLPLVALRKNDLLPVTKLPTFFLGQFARNYHVFSRVS